jgi:hypothetical protein
LDNNLVVQCLFFSLRRRRRQYSNMFEKRLQQQPIGSSSSSYFAPHPFSFISITMSDLKRGDFLRLSFQLFPQGFFFFLGGGVGP